MAHTEHLGEKQIPFHTAWLMITAWVAR
jgi:hypothetical protein